MLSRLVERLTGRPRPWWTPPSDLIIRRPAQEELARVEELYRRSWEETYRPLLPTDAHLPDDATISQAAPSHILVAVVGDNIVGFIQFKKHIISYKLIVFISHLFVEKSFQGRGIGSELLLALRRYFLSAQVIGLNMLSSYRRAAFFYRRHGFMPFARSDEDTPGMGSVNLTYMHVAAACLPRSRLPKSALRFEPDRTPNVPDHLAPSVDVPLPPR